MRFSDTDRDAIDRLPLDPAAEPSFEVLKECLIWPDERPSSISHDGYRTLSDVWIVRGFLHRQVPYEEWGLDPAYFRDVWEYALSAIPNWPGFQRLELSPADRAYLLHCLGLPNSGL